MIAGGNQTLGEELMADWQKIKTEYITTDTSYRKLSEKYGIHYKTIADKGKDEGWKELRSQHTHKTLTKTLDVISTKQVDRATKLICVADKLLGKVESLVDDYPELVMAPQNLKHISGVLKDIKEIQMIRSEADIREQEARIKKLQKEAEEEDQSNKEIKVTIDGDIEVYSK